MIREARLAIHVLASGSSGNATIIEDVQTKRSLLVDCGICKRDFFERAHETGVDPSRIEGILITHEHGDHTKGLGVLTRALKKIDIEPKIYSTKTIMQESSEIEKLREVCDFEYIHSNDALSIAGMGVQVFATSHDTPESLGFRFEQAKDAIGYMTDSGMVPPAAFEALTACRIVALESNYDEHMFETGSYPRMIKQRIASDRGHLSNSQAQKAVEKLLDTKLEHLIAMHISENNNTYRLPREGFEDILRANAHPAIAHVAYQNRVTSI